MKTPTFSLHEKKCQVRGSGAVYITFENEGRKEGNVLFNDALNSFYLWLYGIELMAKDHSDSEI